MAIFETDEIECGFVNVYRAEHGVEYGIVYYSRALAAAMASNSPSLRSALAYRINIKVKE